MQVSLKTKIALWLFTALAVAFFIIDTRGAFIHLDTEPWPHHAMFHAVTGLFYTQALCILVIVLAWIPLRQGHKWSWWAIMFIAVAIHGGHFLGDFMTEGGLRGAQAAQGPGLIFYVLTGLALVLYFVGLALCFGHVQGSRR